jgi:hypothetical protein
MCRFAAQGFKPGLKLLSNAPQRIPAHWIELPIRIEEANDALWSPARFPLKAR